MDPLIPGTVLLVDTEGVLQAKHGKENPDIIYVPQPSDDPDDPLAWSSKRKAFNIFWAMTWCFLAAAIVSGLSPAYLLIEADTGISVADLSTGNGLLFLFLGWGTLITQYIALGYGRRVTLVGSIFLTTFVTLWSAYVGTRAEFFVNRIILGIVSSPMETLIEVIIGDVFFIHQRGLHMGMYSWALWCGAFLCPVASGFVAETMGWRWIQYILTFIGAGLTVLTFLFFEETMFHRDTAPAEIIGVASEVATVREKLQEADGAEVEKQGCSPPPSKIDSRAGVDARDASPSAQSSQQPSTKTFVQKLALWGYSDRRPPSSSNSGARGFLLPFVLLQFPGIVFAGILVGGILSWYNVVGGSLALILGSEPYNFSSNTVGLFYLASAAGVSIGCLLCSAVTDRMTLWLTRRNGGVMEPEQRLWLFIVPLIAHPAGCLLYGIGAWYRISWVGIAFGLGLISVTLPIGSALAFNYILDSYKEVAGEGLVSSILIRNLMGFVFSYAVVPIINNLGLKHAFILIAALGVALWLMCLVMIVFGKSMRRASARRYWSLVERLGTVAH